MILDEVYKFFQKVIKNTHEEGYVYIFSAAIIAFFGFFISSVLGFVLLIIAAWCIYFFRDPVRFVNFDENVICSPADGKIVDISRRFPPIETGLNEEMNKISIFLDIFDVHVNRSPVSGTVEKIVYHKGKFFNAGADKASDENERNTIIMDSIHGKVAFVQIAGFLARRIVCNASYGQHLNAGEKYGIIKFGSRVDLYLPLPLKIKIQLGQTMIGGETIVAEK